MKSACGMSVYCHANKDTEIDVFPVKGCKGTHAIAIAGNERTTVTITGTEEWLASLKTYIDQYLFDLAVHRGEVPEAIEQPATPAESECSNGP